MVISTLTTITVPLASCNEDGHPVPPSPSGTDTTSSLSSTTTAFLRRMISLRCRRSSSDDDDDDDVDHMVHDLESLFTAKAWESILPKHSVVLPGFSEVQRVMIFIQQQAHAVDYDNGENNDNGALTAERLLNQHGLKVRSEGWKSCLSHKFDSLVGSRRHFHNIQLLANVYASQNKQGGTGKSFASIVASYISHEIILDTPVRQQNILGPKWPVVPNGKYVRRPNETFFYKKQDIPSYATLHAVKGSYLVQPGEGEVYDRVNLNLRHFLNNDLDEANYIFLMHGTNLRNARRILGEGARTNETALPSDFGQGFYMTDSLSYAISAAYAVSGAATDSVVIVLPVLRSLLTGPGIFDLTGNERFEDWKAILKYNRRHTAMPMNLLPDHEAAKCTIGPISGNAIRIDQSKEEPRPSRFTQWAIRSECLMISIFESAVADNCIHVIRVLHERLREWTPTPAARNQRGARVGTVGRNNRGRNCRR